MGGAELGGAADIGEADAVEAGFGKKFRGDAADVADEGFRLEARAVFAGDLNAEGMGGDFVLGERDAAVVAFAVGHGGVPEYFPILWGEGGTRQGEFFWGFRLMDVGGEGPGITALFHPPLIAGYVKCLRSYNFEASECLGP